MKHYLEHCPGLSGFSVDDMCRHTNYVQAEEEMETRYHHQLRSRSPRELFAIPEEHQWEVRDCRHYGDPRAWYEGNEEYYEVYNAACRSITAAKGGEENGIDP